MIAFTQFTIVSALAAAGASTSDAIRIGDLYTEGDEAHWTIEVGGQPIGDTWSTYLGEADVAGLKAQHFSAGSKLTTPSAIGPMERRSTLEAWTDDLGHPLRFVLHLEAGGTFSSVEASIADGKATIHVVQGPSKNDLAVAVPPDAYLFANGYVGLLELIAALAPPKQGETRKQQLFVVDGLRMVPFELRHQGTFTTKRGDADVEGAKYRDAFGEVLKLLPDSKITEIEVPAQNMKIRRLDTLAEKFTLEPPKTPAKEFDREEVVIAHGKEGAIKLAGTITKKKGASGRLPAIFFVSGSGGQDREGISSGVDLGTHEILDRLTDEGFLVLRVDDRGVGKSTGPIGDLTFDDLVADARACVDFLLTRADVDATKVFVIGHSEGGETAPILACERPLAGIVLMAGPGRSMFAILREQKKQALEDAGLAPELVEKALDQHKKFLELVSGDGPIDPTRVDVEYRPSLAQRGWFQSHARHDPIAQIKQVKCPVLIAQGEKDLQVSAERDAPLLAAALKEAGNADATLRVFTGLDHLFKKCPHEKPSLADYLTARPVDGGFLDELSAWLKKRAMQ